MKPLIISAWVDPDFYRMRKPLPDGIYMKKSASRMGLDLPRGPDPHTSFTLTSTTFPALIF